MRFKTKQKIAYSLQGQDSQNCEFMWDNLCNKSKMKGSGIGLFSNWVLVKVWCRNRECIFSRAGLASCGWRTSAFFLTEDRAAQSLLNKLIRSNLVDNTNQVEVLQRDPNSPLYSVKSFEELRLWVSIAFCSHIDIMSWLYVFFIQHMFTYMR